jgi:RNase H-like domain found in reverse transcriptase
MVDFLGYRVGIHNISMDSKRVKAIAEWPVPISFRDIQVFLGFTNFYRRFIFLYSKIIIPLTDLLKGIERGRKSGPFQWPDSVEHAFREFIARFQTAPLLQYFDPEKLIKIESDASGSAIDAALSQSAEAHAFSRRVVWKPVAFFSRKMISAELNYNTRDSEMLAIIAAFAE